LVSVWDIETQQRRLAACTPCDGHITSTKSKTALHRLPTAIEVPAEVVETAVKATASLLAELKLAG